MTPIFANPDYPLPPWLYMLIVAVCVAVTHPIVAVVKRRNEKRIAQSAHGFFTWATSTFFNQIATFRASVPATATASQIYAGYATHFSQYLDALRSSVNPNVCPPEYRDAYAVYLGCLTQSLEFLRAKAASNADSPASAATEAAEGRVAQLQNDANNLNAIAQRYAR